MSVTIVKPEHAGGQLADRRASLQDPAYQAFWLLRIGFVVAPILLGSCKFFHVMVDWDRYLAPEFADLFNAEAHTLMYAVGIIEIVAGLVVAVRPRFGGYLVAAWLAGIIFNLLLIADYYDIALRDFGLLLAALSLARLATAFPTHTNSLSCLPASHPSSDQPVGNHLHHRAQRGDPRRIAGNKRCLLGGVLVDRRVIC